MSDLVLWLDALRMTDLGKVGGKNASLGEMIGNLAKLGVSVPGGFATTADAFQTYLEKSGLAKRIQAGTVWVNCFNILDSSLPFGGYKQSGWGREMGHEVLNAYTQTKSVVTLI